MLDGFAAHTHGLWVLIEPRLRGLDDVFRFPALDTALVRRCALFLERACALVEQLKRSPGAIMPDWGFRSNEPRKGGEMRIFVALLIVLAALCYWDVNCNNGTLSDSVIRMERSMFHHMGH